MSVIARLSDLNTLCGFTMYGGDSVNSYPAPYYWRQDTTLCPTYSVIIKDFTPTTIYSSLQLMDLSSITWIPFVIDYTYSDFESYSYNFAFLSKFYNTCYDTTIILSATLHYYDADTGDKKAAVLSTTIFSLSITVGTSYSVGLSSLSVNVDEAKAWNITLTCSNSTNFGNGRPTISYAGT